jgi:hypothetical protein
MHSDEIMEEPRASIGSTKIWSLKKSWDNTDRYRSTTWANDCVMSGIRIIADSFPLFHRTENSFLELPPRGILRALRIFPSIEEVEPNKLEITILIRAEAQQPLWCQCCGGNAHAQGASSGVPVSLAHPVPDA